MSDTPKQLRPGAEQKWACNEDAGCPDSADGNESSAIDPAVVRRAAHQLNNCLTALFCQFDLLAAEVDRDGRHPAKAQIESLLIEASGQVRSLLAASRESPMGETPVR